MLLHALASFPARHPHANQPSGKPAGRAGSTMGLPGTRIAPANPSQLGRMGSARVPNIRWTPRRQLGLASAAMPIARRSLVRHNAGHPRSMEDRLRKVATKNTPMIWPLVGLVALAPMALSRIAFAHAILEDSTPAAGASVPAGPLDLRFRYNSRIDRTRSRLTLTRPDHSRETIPIMPDPAPDIIRCHLDLTPGDYVVRWQVLAVDGHITRGEVQFVVKGP
jgi:copper resistance protein C